MIIGHILYANITRLIAAVAFDAGYWLAFLPSLKDV
jgi:hypothetical protein